MLNILLRFENSVGPLATRTPEPYRVKLGSRTRGHTGKELGLIAN